MHGPIIVHVTMSPWHNKLCNVDNLKDKKTHILNSLTSAVYSECDFKVSNSNKIHDGLDAAIGEGLTWLGHSARGILCHC